MYEISTQVCEQVVDVMKSGSSVPSSLLAKMLKYKVLRHKAAHRAAVAQKVHIYLRRSVIL